jgi:NodT family efflux transporter outer membrane factor (OMF) lipoprotein
MWYLRFWLRGSASAKCKNEFEVRDMRMIRILYFLYVLIILTALTSCKITHKGLMIREQNLPDRYGVLTSDTSSIAKINWKNYFSDTLLHQLIDSAIVNNQDLQIAFQRIENARALVVSSRAPLIPTVNVNLSASQRKFGYYTMDDAGNRVTEFKPGDTIPTHLPDYFIGLTSSWEVDVWGKLQNMRKAAVSNYLAGIEGRNFMVSVLVAEVVSSYFDLLSLDQELDIIRQTIQKQQESLDVVKLQKEAGRSNELAVQQFEAQWIQSRIIEKEIIQKIIQTENRINLLTGRFSQPVARDKNNFFSMMPDNINAGIPSQLLANRPDIREAELRLLATKFELNAAKAAFYPSLTITAGVGYQAFNPRFLFSTPRSMMYNALGGLVMPVINRRAIKAQFNLAKSNQLSAMYQYQKSIIYGFTEVATELSNIEQLHQIYQLKKEQNDILSRAVETSSVLYRTAKANYLEVLLAQQNSLQTKLEMIEVGRSKMMATIRLYKALGGGW